MPTTFLDGPAAGQGLSLRRSPRYLRVVHDHVTHLWDALDLLDDTPAEREEIHVYTLASIPSQVHLCIRGKGRAGSGWYSTAIYRHVDLAADVRQTFREFGAWRAWCQQHAGPNDIDPLAAESR